MSSGALSAWIGFWMCTCTSRAQLRRRSSTGVTGAATTIGRAAPATSLIAAFVVDGEDRCRSRPTTSPGWCARIVAIRARADPDDRSSPRRAIVGDARDPTFPDARVEIDGTGRRVAEQRRLRAEHEPAARRQRERDRGRAQLRERDHARHVRQAIGDRARRIRARSNGTEPQPPRIARELERDVVPVAIGVG